MPAGIYRSIYEAYKEYSAEELCVKDKYLFLKEAFSDVYDDLREGKQTLIVAKENEEILGFAGFKETDEPSQIYPTCPPKTHPFMGGIHGR